MIYKKKFNEIIDKCPVFIPVFKLARVPEWAEGRLSIGDEFTIGDFHHDDSPHIVKIGKDGQFLGNWSIGPGYLSFVEYRQIGGGAK